LRLRLRIFIEQEALRAGGSAKTPNRILAPRVRGHQVVRPIVDHKLAIVLTAVLDGERPDGGVVSQPVAKEF
jgi:hypothetical protein